MHGCMLFPAPYIHTVGAHGAPAVRSNSRSLEARCAKYRGSCPIQRPCTKGVRLVHCQRHSPCQARHCCAPARDAPVAKRGARRATVANAAMHTLCTRSTRVETRMHDGCVLMCDKLAQRRPRHSPNLSCTIAGYCTFDCISMKQRKKTKIQLLAL